MAAPHTTRARPAERVSSCLSATRSPQAWAVRTWPAIAALDAAGLAYDFVGTEADTGGHHEGHNGWNIWLIRQSIDDFLTRCTDSTSTHRAPNIVLLMIGTNDVNNRDDPPNAPTRLGDLLDRIALDAPDALLVVAQIVPNRDPGLDPGGVTDFNAAIPGLVAARAAMGRHIVMVDMHSALAVPADFADMLHPNDGGYDKMATVWLPVIEPLLHAR